MAARIHEKKNSQVIVTAGENPWAIHVYKIEGTASYSEAHNLALATAPFAIDLFGSGIFFIFREEPETKEVEYEQWESTIRYGVRPLTNEKEESFSTAGGTQRIFMSRRNLGNHAPDGSNQPAPDFGGAINVTDDGVEGVEIPVKRFVFTETHYLPIEFVSDAYKGILYNLTGSVNGAPFRAFRPFECLLMEVFGRKRGVEDWAITYSFIASPNLAGLRFGDIGGINKRGHDYLWFRFSTMIDDAAKRLVRRATSAHVEEVFPEGNFADLGI